MTLSSNPGFFQTFHYARRDISSILIYLLRNYFVISKPQTIIFIIFNMAYDYIVNQCALNRNWAFYNTFVEGNRKGLYTQLFFIFFIYFITQVLHAFRYKNNQANPNSIRQSLAGNRITVLRISKQEEEEDTRPDLPWQERRWNRNFAFIFSSHSVALGMVILFSPLAGALVMAYLHLLCFIVYFICEVKVKIVPGKIFRMLMDICNIVLMIIGAAGINYANLNSAGVCYTTI